MDSTRIAALLEPFLAQPNDGLPNDGRTNDGQANDGQANDQRLTANDLDQISTYIDLLLRWNARINLTAIRKPEEIVTRHFGESFFLARHLFPHQPHGQNSCHRERSGPVREAHRAVESKDSYCYDDRSELAARSSKLAVDRGPQHARFWRAGVVDIGSGAGFPALPLKIWAPHIHLTLIESNHKKAAFLREVIRALTLTDVDVIAERAEAVAARLVTFRPDRQAHPSAFPLADVVTVRAVEKFDQILPLAIRFLAPDGRLALLIGEAQLSKVGVLSSEKAPPGLESTPDLAPLPAMKWETIPIPGSRSRLLSVGYRS